MADWYLSLQWQFNEDDAECEENPSPHSIFQEFAGLNPELLSLHTIAKLWGAAQLPIHEEAILEYIEWDQIPLWGEDHTGQHRILWNRDHQGDR